ncbi:MAG: FtsX-like permease family protein [Methanomassiliicoccales archaeon PtaU1.Bin124]|nr:MAG: FtsX-like permease family protein [Methanomassiliicoccales archaeon PtaU1.Bin124]
MAKLSYGQFLWRNLKRRSFRNVATVLTFAVVVCSVLIASFLTEGTSNSTRAGMTRLGADLLVVPQEYASNADAIIITGKPSTFFMNTTEMTKLQAVPGVQRVAPQTFIATLSASCCALPTQLIAFNSTMDFTVTPWLDQELGRPLEKDEVILGYQIKGTDVGQPIIFYGHQFKVAGILQPTGTGVDQSVFVRDSDAIVMARESVKVAWQPIEMNPGQISAILVQLEPGADVQQVSADIAAAAPEVSVITSNHLARKIDAQLASTVGALYLTAGAVTLISLPLIATVSTLVVNERRREIGLYRMMGAKKGFVFNALLAEALILAMVGALIGLVSAAAIVIIFNNTITVSLGIPFLWPGLDAVLLQTWWVMLLTVLLGALSALYPAMMAARSDPYESIRAGQK